MEKDKKGKRNKLILLALLTLLIGFLIPFTWRSFKAVKASLMQESTVTKINPETISGNLMHGGWVPTNTPPKYLTVTNTAAPPTSKPATLTLTATLPLKVTETIPATVTSTLESTKTETPNLTMTPPTIVPFGGTGTPDATETSMPTFTQTATATASPPPTQTAIATISIQQTSTNAPAATKVPATSPPSMPPTVGPGGNPGSYSTLGFVFGLIAVAAFFLYFSGAIATKRNHN